jgi:hypothetical protein
MCYSSKGEYSFKCMQSALTWKKETKLSYLINGNTSHIKKSKYDDNGNEEENVLTF